MPRDFDSLVPSQVLQLLPLPKVSFTAYCTMGKQKFECLQAPRPQFPNLFSTQAPRPFDGPSGRSLLPPGAPCCPLVPPIVDENGGCGAVPPSKPLKNGYLSFKTGAAELIVDENGGCGANCR